MRLGTYSSYGCKMQSLHYCLTFFFFFPTTTFGIIISSPPSCYANNRQMWQRCDINPCRRYIVSRRHLEYYQVIIIIYPLAFTPCIHALRVRRVSPCMYMLVLPLLPSDFWQIAMDGLQYTQLNIRILFN